MTNSKKLNLIAIILVIAVVSFSAGYFITANSAVALSNKTVSESQPEIRPSPAPTAAAVNEHIPFFPGVLSNETSVSDQPVSEKILIIFVRLLLTVLLAAVLAFRPRRNVPLFQRNLNVAQTQILLAVVAAALMIIVGDNTARAFAIFAAVSLVRFRTNIKDPKEITVLLISLALGLATGVGHWELGVFLCLFVLILLWFLEYNESEQVFRNMELTVKTKDTDRIQDILRDIFKKQRIEAEMREITPPDEKNPIGCVMYYLSIRLSASTDRLSDQILAADSHNIDGIQWKQQKNAVLS